MSIEQARRAKPTVKTRSPGSNFNPMLLWAPQCLIGIACFWLAFDIWSMTGRPHEISAFTRSPIHIIAALISTSALWISFCNIQRALIRRHGIVVERNAQIKLERALPADWRMEASVPWYGGDIDVLLTVPADRRFGQNIRPIQFAIEIKALRSLRWNPYAPAQIKGWFGAKTPPGRGTGYFSTKNRQPLKRDIGRQARAAADVFQAKPILWLPRAKGESFAADNVTVVFGGTKNLLEVVSWASDKHFKLLNF
jgi:hypothetical protein